MLVDAHVERRGASRDLVVLVHGYTLTATSLGEVRACVADERPDSDILAPTYPASLFGNMDPSVVAAHLNDCIEAIWNDRIARGASYASVILIGHSLGALIARKAYVFGRGQGQDHPTVVRADRADAPAMQLAPSQWADRVERIVLLAGTNRGWSLYTRPEKMGRLRHLLIRWASPLLWALGIGRTAKSMVRGSPFVANLRVQWLNLARATPGSIPPTIQLLGDHDDVVDQADNIDVQSGADFIYRNVPDTGHVDVIHLAADASGARKRELGYALMTPVEKLRSHFIAPAQRDSSVEHVVFVMHGIRDRGHWTAVLRERIEDTTSNNHKAVVITSSYGYFPMLPFLLRVSRQKNVQWFMDQYTEARARFPNADISFIGHSNGTYLLAAALMRYRACNFKRAVFAGSVVPTHFRWDALVRAGRIEAIKNYVATADKVVGVFPGFFELLRISDIGSAGQNGFSADSAKTHQEEFVIGGHAAAIRAELYPQMIDFILTSRGAARPEVLFAGKQQRFAVAVSKYCWFVWLVLVVIVISGFIAIDWFWTKNQWVHVWIAHAGYAFLLYALLYTT
jgi:pimeloyl-ACP methyl ester carboxylesterase